VRPEQVRLAASGARPDGAPEPGLAGRVTSSVYHGHDARVDVVVETAHGPVTLAARTGGAVAPDVGMPVSVAIAGPVWAIAVEDASTTMPSATHCSPVVRLSSAAPASPI
jgi:hypothetical protein